MEKEGGRRRGGGGKSEKRRKDGERKEREREEGGGIKCNKLLVGRTYYLPPMHHQNTAQSH